MKKTKAFVGILLVFFLVNIFLTSCTPTFDKKTKEGATVGAIAGAALGVLFDAHNRWRGAILGAVIGGIIGGTAAQIMDRASKESATYRKPVTYVSEDNVQKVSAEPVRSEGRCEWVKVQYYEHGRLVKEEMRRVCP